MSGGALLVGTAGWSYPDWKGIVYPPRAPASLDALRYLAAYLDVLEINHTFYRPPEPHVTERWARAVADLPGFAFTAKLHRDFTHAPPATWGGGAAAAFRDGLRPLVDAGRLRALLLQFPFFFAATAESLDHLRRLAEEFGALPLVVEVRHRSFLAPRVLELLRALGLSFCNIDQPLARDSIEPGARVTGPIGYLRLHGRNADAWFTRGAGRDAKYDYLYSPAELRRFAPLVAELRARTETTIVVTNNHFRGKGPANALELKHLLTGEPVEVPPALLAAYPRLAAVAGQAP